MHASSSSIGWDHHTETAIAKQDHKDGLKPEICCWTERHSIFPTTTSKQANFQDGFQVSTQKLSSKHGKSIIPKP
jgi:hypothetical protein